MHPKVVQKRLRHATISITIDTYSHAIPAMQEEEAALIARLVFADERMLLRLDRMEVARQLRHLVPSEG